MQITITLDTEKLTPQDARLLAALAGQPQTSGETPAPAAEKPAQAAKKTSAPKAAAKPEPEPEPEEEPETDEPSEAADDEAPTKDQAIELATKLVSSGGAKKVKAALTEIGVKKVSELSDEDVLTFINLLND